MKKIFSILALLLMAVTNSYATVYEANISSITLIEGESTTVKGITIRWNSGIAYEGDWMGEGGGNSFTISLANGETITRIEITCTAYNLLGSGWTNTSPGAVWSGSAASVNGGEYFENVSHIKVTAEAATVVTGVTLSQTSASMTVGGDALTLTATVAPANAANKTVTWTTSDASVATVTNGVVTAVAAGTATITATATNGTADTGDDKTATCTVTVSPAKYAVTVKDGTEDATNWTITPSTATAGETVTVTYSGTKKVKSVKAKKK